MFYKMGDVDDKSMFLLWMEEYDKMNSCKPFQVTPITLSLAHEGTCLQFYSNNGRWAPLGKALWFMKETKGSQGTHINLWSSQRIREKWQAHAPNGGRHLCPDNSTVASLAVSDPWLIDGYKFDNRVYVLVASITPLVVLFRSGHLRFSQVLYSAEEGSSDPASNETAPADKEKDLRMGMHVTNPRFGLSHTNDTRKVLRPVKDMWRDLVRSHSKERTRVLWERLQMSVRNAALQAVYASRHIWFGHGGYTQW